MASIQPIVNKEGKITSYRLYAYDYCINGKKHMKTKTIHPKETAPTKLKKELNAALADFERAVKSGTDFSDGSSIKFYELLDKWNSNVLASKVATGTITKGCQERYIRMINLYASKELNSMYLAKIKPINVDNTIKGMITKELSNKTIRNYFNALHQCFDYAFKSDLIPYNPCDKVSIVPKSKKQKRKHNVFTIEQAQRFLGDALEVDIPRSDEWKKLMDKVFFYMALYGGFRKAELLALTWNDIDPNTSLVSINKAVGYSDADKEYIKSPKTEKSRRKVKLAAPCLSLLKEWKTECMEICLKAGDAWQGFRGKDFDKNYIFIRNDGRRMSIKEPLKHFRLIIETYNKSVPADLQLPLLRVHDLRHSFASIMHALGVPMATISKILGHSRLSTTLDIYTDSLDGTDIEATELLEKTLAVI